MRGEDRRERKGFRDRPLAMLWAVALVALLVPAGSAGAAEFTVTNTNDTGMGSLPQAIASANANFNGPVVDTINFSGAGASGTIQLQSGLFLTDPIEIQGPGANQLTVRGEGSSDPYSIFNVGSAVTATISGLTITNGSSPTAGGGIVANPGATLTVTAAAITGNAAGTTGGGISNFDGTVTIRDSTISGNSAGTAGGAIASSASGGFAMLAVRNTTVTGNTALSGGGISSSGGLGFSASAEIVSSTITSNTVVAGSANVTSSTPGNQGTATFKSSIVADPLGVAANCSGLTASQGYNLESANTCGFNGTGDQTGTDPMLGSLANNGGPTATMAPLSTSPALDRGLSAGLTTDQRGLARVVNLPAADAPGGDGSDVGAVELQDADGDGVPEPGDNCLTEAGSASNNGCPPPPPDTDGDGIPDATDACPNDAAPGTSNGCPVSTLDTTAPNTKITTGPKGKVEKDAVTFKFSSTEPNSSFKCKLEELGGGGRSATAKARFKPCSSPKRLRGLDEGKYRFSVQATDAAGNTDRTPARRTFELSKKKR